MTAQKQIIYTLKTAKQMFMFLEQTRINDYGTDFSNFLENEVRYYHPDFIHLEIDSYYTFPEKFDSDGNCTVTITIYAENSYTLDAVSELINSYIDIH